MTRPATEQAKSPSTRAAPTDFTAVSSSAQAAACVSDAITNLIAGLAQMPVLLTSTDANVVAFASDLAAANNNLKGACLYNQDGSSKQLGGDVRPPYLAGAGL
jgi:hypothetical protein